MRKKRTSFTLEEDYLLTILVNKFGVGSWTDISRHMIDRTPRQCKERWRSYLCPGISNSPWSKREDDLLIELCSKIGTKWVSIAKFFPGRSDCNVKNRWYTHIAKDLKKKDKEIKNIREENEILDIFTCMYNHDSILDFEIL